MTAFRPDFCMHMQSTILGNVQHTSQRAEQQSPTGRWKKEGTCGRLNLYIVDRLHEARGGHEESTIAHPSGSGDDLASTPMQGL